MEKVQRIIEIYFWKYTEYLESPAENVVEDLSNNLYNLNRIFEDIFKITLCDNQNFVFLMSLRLYYLNRKTIKPELMGIHPQIQTIIGFHLLSSCLVPESDARKAITNIDEKYAKEISKIIVPVNGYIDLHPFFLNVTLYLINLMDSIPVKITSQEFLVIQSFFKHPHLKFLPYMRYDFLHSLNIPKETIEKNLIPYNSVLIYKQTLEENHRISLGVEQLNTNKMFTNFFMQINWAQCNKEFYESRRHEGFYALLAKSFKLLKSERMQPVLDCATILETRVSNDYLWIKKLDSFKKKLDILFYVIGEVTKGHHPETAGLLIYCGASKILTLEDPKPITGVRDFCHEIINNDTLDKMEKTIQVLKSPANRRILSALKKAIWTQATMVLIDYPFDFFFDWDDFGKS